ncbi:hypothetical protein MBANPS3_011612 [Mucor bainieri]
MDIWHWHSTTNTGIQGMPTKAQHCKQTKDPPLFTWCVHESNLYNKGSEDRQICPKKRKHSQAQDTYNAIDKFQNDLDHLFYEWNAIHIVLESIRNAFTVNQDSSSEEYLDQVDKELSIAYDDLMAQVRHLDRRLNKMALEVHQKLLLQPPQQQPPPTPTPSLNRN